MEFVPEKKPRKKYIKIIFISILIIFVIGILFLEIYSPIFINNFEDLDVNSEIKRVGGKFYDKDGDKMYYLDSERTNLDPIIFIHGFGGSTFSWRKNMGALSGKYRVIAFDLLGFGMSKQTKSTDIGLDRSTDIISSFITENKLKNVTIVAHSMGGIVAQKIAIKNQESVISLVLVNSVDSEMVSSGSMFSFLNGILDFPLIKNPLGFIAYSNLINSGVQTAYYDKTQIEKDTLEGYQKGFRYKGTLDTFIKFVKSPPASPVDLSKIKQQVLIYSAENDDVISKDVQDKLAKSITNSKLIRIPKSGHLLMEEQPETINDGIDQWITECEANINVG